MLREVKIDWADLPAPQPLEFPFELPQRVCPDLSQFTPETFPAFLDEIGLVGMGGSGFPASEKIRAGMGAHTLIINGVECEPGITIDQSVLLHESHWVMAGVNASATAIGAQRIVLAVRNDTSFISALKERYREFEIVPFSHRYPAGAEKLILQKLTGRRPPPGRRPYQLGYMVQNAVSLRAIGRAVLDGIPVIERPLTLVMPLTGFHKNIVVPVGLSVRDVLEHYNLPYDPGIHFIADSGLMMGRETSLEAPVRKTTLALMVLDRDMAWREERPCIRCGECNNTCPLGLHPYSLIGCIEKGRTRNPAFKAQITECFLCGMCSAVCPSDIPLVHVLKQGKSCL
jgi:electron transport complex protein RnfC